ncbi:hypothetical protein DL769_001881 [Monosporascus sp. CRB-8-3]|nr:hypothetical protein DL769_001881 [Monosporascus sp. CRB-8-3]
MGRNSSARFKNRTEVFLWRIAVGGSDLHEAILAAAQKAGIKVFNKKRVVSYNFEVAINRTSRAGTGDVAYRILIPGKKLYALTGDFVQWRLCDLPNLTRWAHPWGKAVLLGDSCHPMLPYLAQGRCAVVRGRCGAAAVPRPRPRPVRRPQTLRGIRMPRASPVQAMVRGHQYILHIEDSEQRARDKRRQASASENPIFRGYDERRKWLFSHDAEVMVWRIRIGRWLRRAAVSLLTEQGLTLKT